MKLNRPVSDGQNGNGRYERGNFLINLHKHQQPNTNSGFETLQGHLGVEMVLPPGLSALGT
jgi:hypothetical protein